MSVQKIIFSPRFFLGDMQTESPYGVNVIGSVAEWSIAPVLKTGNGKPFVSSNLTASAKSILQKYFQPNFKNSCCLFKLNFLNIYVLVLSQLDKLDTSEHKQLLNDRW